MEMLRLSLGSIGLLVFALVAICNIKYILDFVLRRKTSSLIPFVGGVIGAIGILIFPNPQIHFYWWLPLVLDPGCCYLLVMQIWGLLFKRKTNP